MSWSTLIVERQGGVARVRLNRPDKRNAQTVEMWDELRRVGLELEADPTVRVVVVSGEGHSFSAGIDLSVIMGQAQGKPTLPLEVELVQQAFTWLRDARFATIAMVQGYALGAGFQLALACDLRVFSSDAVVALPEISFGILPDLGGCAWLPGIIGAARTKELAFTGDRLGAEDALRYGIANRVVARDQLESTTVALAATIAAKAPLGIAGIKRAVAAAEQSSEAAIRASAREVRICLGSADFREAGRAMLEKREPRFSGK